MISDNVNVEVQELNFGFVERETEKAIDSLNGVLGSNNGWFIQFIREIMEMIQNGHKITDIVIRSNQVIKIGALKNFRPLELKVGGHIFKPQKLDIQAVTRALGQEDIFLGGKSSVDFAVAIYGIGIFRINYSRDMSGLRLSIRYLDFDIPDFESMQYPQAYKDLFNRLIREKDEKDTNGKARTGGKIGSGGLVLHIGPTGGGKTTAIFSAIKMISGRITGTIMTYEDPIEYRILKSMADVSQFELGKHIVPQPGKSMAETIRGHLVRNNPSVAMIAEVRSGEEIYDVFNTANRGHLVFSSLHAKNTYEALTLADSIMGESRGLIASGLLAIVSHYLHLTEDGRILPLYEVFMPNEIARGMISSGGKNLAKLRRLLYKENTIPNSVSFEQYINKLKTSGTIGEEDRREIMASMSTSVITKEEVEN